MVVLDVVDLEPFFRLKMVDFDPHPGRRTERRHDYVRPQTSRGRERGGTGKCVGTRK